jgi:hypothetical protein
MGYLCFTFMLKTRYWTRGFKPHAQAQTHAQIWIRLMHLPQEYWRKTTLFEIASSLGTPLAIDDATLSRRFGVFARVLVDVDLAEQLFESVVVETDGYALSIDIQYEKQPTFCANCKILGHNLQNCRKLNGSSNNEGTIKLNTRSELNGKKHVDTNMLGKKRVSGAQKDSLSLPNRNQAGSSLLHKGTAKGATSSAMIFNLNTASDDNTHCEQADTELHNITNSPDHHLRPGSLNDLHDTENLYKEGDKEDVIITAIMKDGISNPLFGVELQSPSALALHNPFDKLQEDGDIHFEENPLMDQVQHQPSEHTILEPVVILPQKNVGPVPPKAAIPVGESHHKVVLSPIKMATPVTTYEELGPDKGRVHAIGGSKNVSAAAKKSVQILSKLWGDVVDSDHTTDGTMDLDTDTEIVPKFSRKLGKSSSSTRGKGLDGITSSEHIQTRSKKGVIKHNPKYAS